MLSSRCVIIRGGASASAVAGLLTEPWLDDLENHAARGFSETPVGLPGRLEPVVLLTLPIQALYRALDKFRERHSCDRRPSRDARAREAGAIRIQAACPTGPAYAAEALLVRSHS